MHTTTILFRKAKIKKNKAYKFGQSLKKDEEVFVQERFAGRGRIIYTAVRKENDTVEFSLTRSEFEYTEKTKFVVCVQRVSYSMKNIEVDAIDVKEAESLAIDVAGGLEFSEDSAEYQTVGSTLTKEQHKQIYGN